MIYNIPPNFPALQLLRDENIDVDSLFSFQNEPSNSLRIAILNLMPLKITTEMDILRLLCNSPLPIHLDFVNIESHTPKNTPIEHITEYYKPFSSIMADRYDGLIVTGAPVELIPFEEVNYWQELTTVFDWGRKNVKSKFYICWGAQAALYHFYRIPKYELDKKLFGVYSHSLHHPHHLLFQGFDDKFFVPHSRHTTILKEDILMHHELSLLSESDEAGVYIISNNEEFEFFITGHSEYAPLALHNEYVRDMKKGLTNVDLPINYYIDNNSDDKPNVIWRSHAYLLFTNWLHHFVNK